MIKFAIGVPTYNRAEMIEEMLIRCAELYQKEKIDVYFFDSSEDNQTEKIVNSYTLNYKNLYYQKVPSSIHSNIKVLNIYKEFSLKRKYHYLSICPDYMQFTEEGVQRIKIECEKRFDICILNFRDVENIGEKIYTDKNEIFFDCAWHMTSYMATIVNLNFLEDVDWGHIFKYYTIPEKVNFSHVALLFEQLAKRNYIKAIHIPIFSKHIRISSFRSNPYWKKDTFLIWCKYWPEMIYSLPNCYHKKNEVIRKHGINSKILSLHNFIRLRKEKIYNINIYQKYRLEWKNLTNVSKYLLKILAVMPSQIVWMFSVNEWKQRTLRRKVTKFCKDNRDVYIYGCGFVARKTSDLLNSLNLKCQAYIVSDISNEKKTYNGVEVISCQDFFSRTTKSGVIIALKKENTKQVIQDKSRLVQYPLFLMWKYIDSLE